MKGFIRCAAALSALALAGASYGWNDTGKMMIAAIAQDRLNNQAYQACEKLLAVGGTDKTKGFVAASCWAEENKTPENASWFSIPTPIRLDGRPTTAAVPEQNIVWAIQHFSEILSDSAKPEAERADALRYLIAFVIEVHEPLDAATLESEQHPDGDHGGVDTVIRADDMFPKLSQQPTNLRELWDDGAGLFNPGEFPRPLDQASSAKVHLTSINLTAKYPETDQNLSLLAANLDPGTWAAESHRIAKDTAYGLPSTGTVSLAYITIAKTVAGQRACLAGYRLAGLLNKILGK